MDAVRMAAAYGRPACLALLIPRSTARIKRSDPRYPNDKPGTRYQLVGSALEHGHLEQLAQGLLDCVNTMSITWIRVAVKGGDMKAARWVYILLGRYGNPVGAVDAALEDGNMEMLRWLLDCFEVSVELARVVPCGDYDTRIVLFLSLNCSECDREWAFDYAMKGVSSEHV